MEHQDSKGIEIIPGLLYFLSVPEGFVAQSTATHNYFSTSTTLIYTAFFADFGPLDLGKTYQFCKDLDTRLIEMEANNSKDGAKGCVTYYCINHGHHQANSAVLLMAYLIFVRDYTAEQAYLPFYGIQPLFTTFRDAAFCVNSFPLTVLDCTRAFRRAHQCKHFVYGEFSLPAFQKFSKLQHGDFSWIIPGKLVAFSGPLSKRRVLSEGVYSLRPEEYIPIMKTLGITCIVRFNSKCYDRNVYLNAGIRHVDLYYEDGGNPSDGILQAFLSVCEAEKGAVAVHCKAGLGRTGTNIAAYMMKHYGYSAKETIAWCRVCRPGSVVGPQQQYLMSIEPRMFRDGAALRARMQRSNNHGQPQAQDERRQLGRGSGNAKLIPPIMGTSVSNGVGILFNTRDKLSKLEITGTGASDKSTVKYYVRPNTSGGTSAASAVQSSSHTHTQLRLAAVEKGSRSMSGSVANDNGATTRRSTDGKMLTPRVHVNNCGSVANSSGTQQQQKSREGFAASSTGGEYTGTSTAVTEVSRSYNGPIQGQGLKHRPSTSGNASVRKPKASPVSHHTKVRQVRSGGRSGRYG